MFKLRPRCARSLINTLSQKIKRMSASIKTRVIAERLNGAK